MRGHLNESRLKTQRKCARHSTCIKLRRKMVSQSEISPEIVVSNKYERTFVPGYYDELIKGAEDDATQNLCPTFSTVATCQHILRLCTYDPRFAHTQPAQWPP